MTKINPPGTTLETVLASTEFPPSPRDSLGRFLPGTVPNPTGQGKAASFFRLRCRDFMDARGWAELERLALNARRPESQHKALELIAAYAYGRPAQRHEVLVDDTGARSLVDGLTQMMVEDLAKRRLVAKGSVVEGEIIQESVADASK